jgi:hypothetical protein
MMSHYVLYLMTILNVQNLPLTHDLGIRCVSEVFDFDR